VIRFLVAITIVASSARADAAADFTTDVKPIFAKSCVSCHGPDKQKGGLRLDRRADALRGGDSGPAIVPKNSNASILLQRVGSADPDHVMPPNGKTLTNAEIEQLRRWIEAGASWPDDGSSASHPRDWWSLKPLSKPPLPRRPDGPAHPIDAFIRAKLSEHSLTPSPEADRRTLIRRLSYDVTGLPPTPEDIARFLNDRSPDAYEQLVDRLLASPHYGERWARHWLDVVHFGETHGYDKDKPRPNAWPYRDYVIRAFNEDKPYSRFVREQIAGDVLYPGTIDGIEALGFLAAGPWDFIGHVELPETKIDGKVARHLDRDDFVSNTMSTFQSVTVHCAQCHNHKFDPIRQQEYFALQAIFAAIDRTEVAYDADQSIYTRRRELELKRQTVRAGIAKWESRAGETLLALDRRIADVSRATTARPEYGYHSALATRADTTKWVQVDLGEAVAIDRVVLRACDDDFNKIGAGFGFPVRYRVEVSDDESFPSARVLADRTGADQPNPRHDPVEIAVNGKSGRYLRITATKLATRLPTDYHFALAELEILAKDGRNRAAGRPVTALDSIEAPVRWRKSNLTDGIVPPGSKRSTAEAEQWKQQRDELVRSRLKEQEYRDYRHALADAESIEADMKRLGAPTRHAYIGAVHTGSGTFLGTGATGGQPREIRLLQRGDITKPGEVIRPGTLSVLGLPFELKEPHTEADRRAALARWLTHHDNVLTWRSIVNRVWQYHFGRGLVDTPNDFGKMGQLPSHPELLDWLAVEFRDSGGSLKSLHRRILLSATYRQQSNGTGGAAIDAENRFLWRQNRRKLEAEAVRDSILSVAGKLDLARGGPSFQDFVVEKPEHSPHYQYHLHDQDDPRTHRRAVYRFTVRSKQQPFMASLDCADPSLAVEKRNQSLSPQQALALLNNRLTLTMAKHFAARLEREAMDLSRQVDRAVRLALGREPTKQESDELTDYARTHGLVNLCRVILNLNEFVFVD
jgi:mono/diheme cytochrome c family protein